MRGFVPEAGNGMNKFTERDYTGWLVFWPEDVEV